MHKPKPYVPDPWNPKNRAERRKARRDTGFYRAPLSSFSREGFPFQDTFKFDYAYPGVQPGDLVSFDVETVDGPTSTEGNVAVVENGTHAVVVSGRRRVQVLQALRDLNFSVSPDASLRGV